MPWVESRQKARSACREIIHRSLVQPLYQRKVYTDEARIDLYSLEDARPLSDHGHMPSEVYHHFGQQNCQTQTLEAK